MAPVHTLARHPSGGIVSALMTSCSAMGMNRDHLEALHWPSTPLPAANEGEMPVLCKMDGVVHALIQPEHG